MTDLGSLRQQAEISRRYSSAQVWVGQQAGMPSAVVSKSALLAQKTVSLTPATVDAFEKFRGARSHVPFVEILESAHVAVSKIYAGLEGPAKDDGVVAHSDVLVTLLEGACASFGFKPVSSPLPL